MLTTTRRPQDPFPISTISYIHIYIHTHTHTLTHTHTHAHTHAHTHTHAHNAHTDTHILSCITAGDVGGLVAPAAAACRGGDDDDTRVKHFSPDLYR